MTSKDFVRQAYALEPFGGPILKRSIENVELKIVAPIVVDQATGGNKGRNKRARRA
jgi:hypothetical protein